MERGRLRVAWLMAGAALLAAILVGRLAYWQVLRHDSMRLLADQQHRVTVKLPAHRGRILDRAGQPLAIDTQVYNVAADPQVIPAAARPAAARALAPILGIDSVQLLAQLAEPVRFEYLKHRVDQATRDRVEALHLTGVFFEDETQRSYLAGTAAAAPADARSLASNLLGFVNYEGRPLYGVEEYYNRWLQGRDGTEATIRDGSGTAIVLGDSRRVDPRNGDDVVLALDSQIQYFTEKALAEGVQKTGSESGSAIIMEPQTGRIVAWADYPTYDANRFATTDNKLFSDQVVSGLYEPGSVMKVVTLSGGLDDGAITPTYSFNETGGVSIGGSYIRDWDNKAHGNVDMTYVLSHSLNVGAIKVLQLEGGQKFYDTLQRFGIGQKTGVDVADEVSAPLPPLSQRRPNELATMTFGQGVAVTPIEMLTALNTVANGGRMVRPEVATALIDADGKRTELPIDPGSQIVAPATNDEMRQMMIQTVEKGSGWTVKMDGWKDRIAGKTGTANVPVAGKYTPDTIATFAGFMPADHPRFTMIVIMRKPKGGGLMNISGPLGQEGTFAAAPTWKEIAQQILLQWQITP